MSHSVPIWLSILGQIFHVSSMVGGGERWGGGKIELGYRDKKGFVLHLYATLMQKISFHETMITIFPSLVLYVLFSFYSTALLPLKS